MADVSLAYGGMYLSSSSANTNPTTPAKANGTTTSMGLNQFTHTSNRLTYTGTATRTFEITVCISISTSAAETFDVYIYKNGTVITGTQIQRKTSNNDIGACALGGLVSLATNDYIELYVHVAGSANITWEYGTIVARVAG